MHGDADFFLTHAEIAGAFTKNEAFHSSYSHSTMPITRTIHIQRQLNALKLAHVAISHSQNCQEF